MRISKVMRQLHRVVVVGGGAGGLELVTYLSRSLGKKNLIQPVLVDGTPTHIWKPLLHEVATGALNTGEDEINYFSHGYRTGYNFEMGWMNGLDRSQKIINVAPITDADGTQVAPSRQIPYDTLVMAVGGTTHSFGTPGVDEHCICLNSPAEANYLRRKLLGQVLQHHLGTAPEGKLRIGIVGGGATGVELAAEIHHTICELKTYGANLKEQHLDMTIMEGGPRLLLTSEKSLSKFATKQLQKRHVNVMTNCMIKEVTAKGFVLSSGTLIEKELKVWTAGIKAPDWLKGIGLQVNKFNRIKVNEHLQTFDDPSIYAIGDCACAPIKGKPKACCPATAQVAHQQAEWLTKKIGANLLNKRCRPFVYKPKGQLVSLGSTTAVGSLALAKRLNYYVEGKGAKAIYASLYRMHQGVLYGWTKAILLWIGNRLRSVAKPQLKLH